MTKHLRPASRIAIAGTVFALVLGACGSNSGAPATTGGALPSQSPMPTVAQSQPQPTATSSVAAGSPTAVDECTLLTAAEIESATGYEVVGSNPDPGDGLSRCEWTLADNGGTVGLRVELDSTRAQRDHDFNCSEGFGLTAISGLGDSACGDEIAGGTYLVYALRGDDQVKLRMQADYQIDDAAWTSLAGAVIARLP